MRKKNTLQILSLLCLVVPLCGYANKHESPVNLKKIFVKPEKLNTKIVLEASAPLHISRTFYSKETPVTIVIEMDRVETALKPQSIKKDSPLIREIKVEKTGAAKHRILIGLKEQVFYRIYSDRKQTIIELNRIQKALSGYVLESETEQKLKKMPQQKIDFQKVVVSKEKGRIDITAKLSDSAVFQAFALDHPLRLVVDLFNTAYIEPTSVYPVQKLGVEKVKTGQFQMTIPHAITRVVFELTEPKFYNLSTAKDELTISFFKEALFSVPLRAGIVEPIFPAPKAPVSEIAAPWIPAPVSEYVRETVPPKAEVQVKPVSPKYQPSRRIPPAQEQFPEEQPWLDASGAAETPYSGEIISLEFKDADSRDVILYYAETKKLRRIGQYPFVRIRGEIPTAEVMKTLLERYAEDIKYGFDLTGFGDLYLPFIEQIRTASFEEKELRVGDKLMWMLFRSRGKVKVVENLEWAGEKPLPVFSFVVKKGYNHYEFIMPNPCGNVALFKVEEVIPDPVCDIEVYPAKANINDPITVDMSGSQHAKSLEVEVFDQEGRKVATQRLSPDSPKWEIRFNEPGEYFFKSRVWNMKEKSSENPCEAKTYINFPPISNLWTSCLPCEDFVDQLVTFSASDSNDPDGEVVKANFEISNKAGNTVAAFEDLEKPFIWENIFEKPGLYTITAFVTDDFGAMSQRSSIELGVTQRRLFFLADVGPLYARGSQGSFVSARMGVLYKLVPDTFEFIISGGGALAFAGEPWKSYSIANMLLNVHAGSAFFGAGAGFSKEVKETRKSDAELIANVGFDVFSNYTTMSMGSVFFEARGPVGKRRSFSDHHKLMLGFRYIF